MKKKLIKRNVVTRTAALAACGILVLGGTGAAVYVQAAGQEGMAGSQESTAAGQENTAGGQESTAAGQENTAGSQENHTEKDTEKNGRSEENASGTGDHRRDNAQERTDKQEDTAEYDAGQITKEETVYVLAGADGEVKKIIVSDWLKNAPGAEELTDRSQLINVENVKGEEVYTVGQDDAWIWNAGGKDIYYQGNIDKPLPVSISVSYLLDGKKMTAEEMAGKSGRVTIRYDYTNNQYEYVDVNGVRTRIYVPFAVVTGLVLDDDVFTDVEVTNGRLVNDGDRTMVMGIAFPGLQDNLDVDEEKLSLPDYMEITADVRNFELGMTAAIATNQLFNGIEMDEGTLMDDLHKMLDELENAMEQLEDGSSRLYDGLCTLLEKSGELIGGIDKLYAGTGELKAGIVTLDQGASQLQSGAGKLDDGLSLLSSKNGELMGGAGQVFDTLLSAAGAQLNSRLNPAGISVPAMTAENYAQVLEGIIASLDEDSLYQKALETVTAAVEEQRGHIEALVTANVEAAVREKVTEAVAEQIRPQVVAGVQKNVEEQVIQAATGMSREAYEAAVAAGMVDEETRNAVQGAVEAQMASEAVQGMISEMLEAQMASEEVRAIIDANTAAQLQSDEVREMIASKTEAQVQQAISENMAGSEVQGQLASASEGVKAILSLKASLDSYNTFYRGLQDYTSGVSEAADGAGALSAGIGELRSGTGRISEGASQLQEGIRTMQNAAPALTDGISQLKDGAKQLTGGLKEFDAQGIQKLKDAADGDLEGVIGRLKAITEVSERYDSFAGIGDDMEGKVKFIYRTDAITAEE